MVRLTSWFTLASAGGVFAGASAAANNRRSLQVTDDSNLGDGTQGDLSDDASFQAGLDDLNLQLSTFAGRVHATNNTDWMRECAEYFKRGGFGTNALKVKYSTYHLKNKPSGLCTFQLWVEFNAWNDELQDVLSETNLLTTNYEEIEDKLPPIALPGFMSFPESAKDVSEIVKFAQANSLKVSIKNSGHSYTAGTSSKGSLQMNLRKFPQYSFTDIYECDEDRDYTPLSGPDSSCKLALARGKTAVARVGGGQGNDDMYRSVMDFNYAEPRTKRYNVVGGAEGMVGGGGGFMMGGGLGRGEERLYGSGADQVLELEMILPDGQHVKFGPTEWEEKDGFEYPQTTVVEGKCNANIHHDESKWEWVECEEGTPAANVSFKDLWFSVRGGGGGTWGVVLSAVHNLHELLPQYVVGVDLVDPSDDVLLKTCAKLEGDSECPRYKAMMSNMWVDFIIDLLWNEENEIGVDKELSVRCGFTGNAFLNPIVSSSGGALKCHGHGIQEKFNQAWQTSVSKSRFILDGYGEEELCEIKSRIFLEGGAYDRWHRSQMEANIYDPGASYSPMGHYFDSSGPEGTSRAYDATWPGALLPASLLATKSIAVFALLTITGGGHTIPFSSQNDGMTPMSEVYHSGGIQTYLWPFLTAGAIDPENPCVFSKEIITAMEEEIGVQQEWVLEHLGYEAGGDFPGYSEYNHIYLNYAGVLKSDPTKPCPLMSTSEEKKELCLSAQETVWGSANFRRLTAIKNGIDPNNTFDVHFGVGNDERPGPITDYCASKGTDPTVPPLTGPDMSAMRAGETPEECKTDFPDPVDPVSSLDGASEPTASDGDDQSDSVSEPEPDDGVIADQPPATSDGNAKLAALYYVSALGTIAMTLLLF